MLLILEDVKNTAYHLATNSLRQVCLVLACRKQSLSQQMYMLLNSKVLCETQCLMLGVHACPFHDTISGLLILHY